ncbi:YceI family protein [Puniceicoccaceae bacterium K14]|nr:YceI family protein [Puniceicoccaceae bacterium K14]
MKQIRISNLAKFAFAFALASILGSASYAAEYVLKEHRIHWSGSMPASTHEGLLTPLSTVVDIDDAGVINKLEVVLDMNSIDVTDLTGKKRDKLAKHLLSRDFFYVKEHPTAKFKLDRHEDGSLVGEVEIRGVVKPITIPVEVTGSVSEGWTLEGAFAFNRQDFNVNYQNGGILGAAKDKLIRDMIDLEIELKVGPTS